MRLFFIILLCLFFCSPPALAAHSGEDASAQKTSGATNRNSERSASQKAEAADKKPDASPPEQAENDDARQEQSSEAAQDRAWEEMWSGQRELVNEIRETALKLSDAFSEQTQTLSNALQPFEREARRLLIFANTFHNFPNPLEAVSRRMSATIADIDETLAPVNLARSEAEAMLKRVSQMAASIPDDVDKSRLSEEMRGYMNDISQTRLRLTAVLAQYNSIVPSLGLVKTLAQARESINARLPELWRDYYLQRPVAWLNPANWINLERDINYSRQSLLLRLPVEMPGSAPQWGTAFIRFFIGLFFSGIIALIIKRRLIKPDSSPAAQHIFRVSLPWFILGFALLGSALSASGDFFRLFLAVGSACVLVAQVCLAWDLRRLRYPEIALVRSPFMSLLPLAFLAYTLLYLPLTAPLALVVWSSIITIFLVLQRHRKKPKLGQVQFEAGVLDCNVVVIWICLFLALSGLHIYSMGLYIAYVSISVALELSIGGMAVVNGLNEHLPQEGARAMLMRLLVAMAAPFVLVLAVAGVCLWVAMLPGGTYLLSEYALKGVNIGATQFNIIQILVIISAFYLARTLVAMGTRFLARLPQQGVHFDPTLITPLQTFLTYTVWAVFGLLVLRALGMELSSLAMVAGGLSVGIGFGLQTIVNNFISGLILIFGRTLQVGDVVEVGGLTGRVRKISVRATMVETYDNAVIYVPNSEFVSGRLINWTSFSRSVRCQVEVGVAYGSDTAKVVQLLIATAKAHDNTLKYPIPSVVFSDFGASTLNFQLRFWVKDYDLAVAAQSDIRLEINRVFNQEKIEIAFPQLDVHLKNQKSAPASSGKPKILRKHPIKSPRPQPAAKKSSTS